VCIIRLQNTVSGAARPALRGKGDQNLHCLQWAQFQGWSTWTLKGLPSTRVLRQSQGLSFLQNPPFFAFKVAQKAGFSGVNVYH
jgi:hypothetical protein